MAGEETKDEEEKSYLDFEAFLREKEEAENL